MVRVPECCTRQAYDGTNLVVDMIKLVSVQDEAITIVNELNRIFALAQILYPKLISDLGTFVLCDGLDVVEVGLVLSLEEDVGKAN